MKIAVSVAKADLDAPVDPSFAGCPLFVVVDSDTWDFEAVENTAPGSDNPGEHAAALVASAGAEAVVAADFGPGAIQALARAGLAVYAPQPGMSARQAVEAVKAGELPAIIIPPSTAAAGPCCRMRMVAALSQAAQPPTALWAQIPEPDAVRALREQLNLLQQQLDALRRRVEQLEKRADAFPDK